MDNPAQYIDYTIVAPDAVFGRFTEGVRDCVKYNFASFCVSPLCVHLISNLLKNHPECSTVPCSVVGFPHGSTTTTSKLVELNTAIYDGAKEIDFVLSIGSVKTGDWLRVKHEFETLKFASSHQALSKVILEVCYLTDDEIKHCCDLAVETGLDFVKTSTGFGRELKPVETARYVKLMADCVKSTNVKVKASGWIRTLSDFNLMLECGASRIGCSKAVEIIKEFQGEKI